MPRSNAPRIFQRPLGDYFFREVTCIVFTHHEKCRPMLKGAGRHSFFKSNSRRAKAVATRKRSHGPGRIRAEKGAADAGAVHAYCAGQPGSVVEFRHSDVKL
jgi:hypothetical protein